MSKSRLLSSDSVFHRRLLIGLGVLLAAALLAGLVARLAGGGPADHPAPASSATASAVAGPGSWAASSPTAVATATVSTGAGAGAEAGPSVARPPHTGSPTDFAQAFARTLWSYDTRMLDQQHFVNGLRLWLTPEVQYADAASVESQLPDPLLWSRMRDQAQTSTADIAEAHLPAAFQQAIAKNPEALSTAYIYAVTVTGKVEVAWNGGGRGAEERAITLAVQCRPQRDCALASIASTVYP
ncbi:hypothetical protein ACFVUH_08525 [Kitasatospora sp. NPDC058032]|uniref:hypothetical protein n=1 Tax=Kitasatospora sp. NPDC058032 TaxID=3346307 RepID=UPI0036DDE92D